MATRDYKTGSDTTTTTRNQTTNTTRTPYGPAGPMINDVLQRGQGLSYGIPTMYEGQTYADFDPLQTRGQNSLVRYAESGLGGNYQPTRNTWEGMLNAPSNVASNPHIANQLEQQRNQAGLTQQMLGQNQQQAYDVQSRALGRDYDAMRNNLNQQFDYQSGLMDENFQENVLPSIANESIAAGGFGSRDAIAKGIAGRGYGREQANLAARQQNQLSQLAAQGTGQLGDLSRQNQLAMNQQTLQGAQNLANAGADTYMNAYNQALAQQRYGLGFSPTVANMGMAGANILSGVGRERQAQDQLGINEQIARHEFAQEAPWDSLERQARLLQIAQPYASQNQNQDYTSTASGNSVRNSTRTANQGTSGWLGLAGLAAGGAMEYFNGQNGGNNGGTVGQGVTYGGENVSAIPTTGSWDDVPDPEFGWGNTSNYNYGGSTGAFGY